jgi:hypothetical protein
MNWLPNIAATGPASPTAASHAMLPPAERPVTPEIPDIEEDRLALAVRIATAASRIASSAIRNEMTITVGEPTHATARNEVAMPVELVEQYVEAFGIAGAIDNIAASVIQSIGCVSVLGEEYPRAYTRANSRASNVSSEDRLSGWLAVQTAGTVGFREALRALPGWSGFAAALRTQQQTELRNVIAKSIDSGDPVAAAVAAVWAAIAGVETDGLPPEIQQAVADETARNRRRRPSKWNAWATGTVNRLTERLGRSEIEQRIEQAQSTSQQAEQAFSAAVGDQQRRTAHSEALTAARRVMEATENRHRNALPDLSRTGKIRSRAPRPIRASEQVRVAPTVPGGPVIVPPSEGSDRWDGRFEIITLPDASSASTSRLVAASSRIAETVRRSRWIVPRPPQRLIAQRSGDFDASAVDRLVVGGADAERIYTRRPEHGAARIAIGLLVDCSGSMGGSPIEEAKVVAAGLLLGFASDPRVSVEVFGHDFGRAVRIHDAGNRVAAIANMRAGDSNADGPAIDLAADALRKRHPRAAAHALVLIADGQPSADGYHGTKAQNDVAKRIARLRRSGTRFSAIAVGYGIPAEAACRMWRSSWTHVQSAIDAEAPVRQTILSLAREIAAG